MPQPRLLSTSLLLPPAIHCTVFWLLLLDKCLIVHFLGQRESELLSLGNRRRDCVQRCVGFWGGWEIWFLLRSAMWPSEDPCAPKWNTLSEGIPTGSGGSQAETEGDRCPRQSCSDTAARPAIWSHSYNIGQVFVYMSYLLNQCFTTIYVKEKSSLISKNVWG